MIELSNLTAQTLNPGQALTFDSVIHQSCCRKNECFTKQLPTSVRLTGGCNAMYLVEFSGNVSGAAAAALQLSIALANQPLPEARMNSTPAAANNLNNVSTGTYIVLTCGDLDRVSVINSGTVPVTVSPGANLRIRRVA